MFGTCWRHFVEYRRGNSGFVLWHSWLISFLLALRLTTNSQHIWSSLDGSYVEILCSWPSLQMVCPSWEYGTDLLTWYLLALALASKNFSFMAFSLPFTQIELLPDQAWCSLVESFWRSVVCLPWMLLLLFSSSSWKCGRSNVRHPVLLCYVLFWRSFSCYIYYAISHRAPLALPKALTSLKLSPFKVPFIR